MTKIKQKRSVKLPRRTAARTSKVHRPDLVTFYEAKLEAEWGPYDLKRVFDADERSVIILDTRKPAAYAEEHIPQAINIPGEELERRLDELPKDKHIVPYCWSVTCHLATRAALVLARHRFKVHELAGGIGAWKDYGFAVTSTADQEPALN